MRILYIFGRYLPDFYGGAELSNKNMVELNKKKHDVFVIALSNRSLYESIDGIDVYRFGDKFFYKGNAFIKINLLKIRYLKKILEVVKNIKPDIVHVSGAECSFIGYSIKKLLGVPYIVHVRGYWIFQNWGLVEKYLSSADNIVYVSKYLEDFYCKNFGDKYRGVVIYNLVNIDNNPLFDFNKKNKSFVYAGRIDDRRKGIVELIDGFNLFCRNHKDHHLFLVGNGDINIKNNLNIVKCGFVDHKKLMDILSFSRFVVVPSKMPEPFGRVVIESMLSGSFVLTTGKGGISEIVNNAFIFDSNPVDISNIFSKAVGLSDTVYNKMVVDNYNYVIEHFGSNVLLGCYNNLYENLFRGFI